VNREALKSAARAAIVMPSVFAFASTVIARPQTSIFAAFGCFATLVLVEFGGRARERLIAHVGLAAVGALFVTVGTLCSRTPWLAAIAMALVGFVVLFSGAFSGYLAAGTAAASLLFILPVSIAAPNSAIGDRLLGWMLATTVSTAATLLLWPPRQRAGLRRAAATAVRAVAELAAAPSSADATARAEAAGQAVKALGGVSLGSQHRPAGPTTSTAALAALPGELDWLRSFLVPTAELPYLVLASQEDADVVASAVEVLGACASRLDGGDDEPDLSALEQARTAAARALMRRLPELPSTSEAQDPLREFEPSFRVRIIGGAALQLAEYAMRATSFDSGSVSLADTRQLVRRHASPRSTWFQNSARGAVALALAVYIAQRSGLQHGFWVVLGTLSVLRSNALGTGRSIAAALAGTAVGLVVGALLVLAIGTHHPVLWVVLPCAVLLAAYAPRAISFSAGQAAFTVVLFVLFNLIQPVGWRVGIVRVEDVAIGFAISLGIGLLFWPRGAATLLRRDFAAAFVAGADDIVAAMHALIGRTDHSERARDEQAEAALHRLDDTFRQYLGERAASAVSVEDIAALVSSASRVRRTAESLAALSEMMGGAAALASCEMNLEGELNAMQAWYVSLGRALTESRTVQPAHLPDLDGRRRLLDCIGNAARSRDKPTVHAALLLLWAAEHLESQRRLETYIATHANAQWAQQPERRRLRGLLQFAVAP
jgi:uncharacterized membrane protein YccC